jgi:hypothetical protein
LFQRNIYNSRIFQYLQASIRSIPEIVSGENVTEFGAEINPFP